MKFELYVGHPSYIDETVEMLGEDSAIDGLVVMAQRAPKHGSAKPGRMVVISTQQETHYASLAGKLPITWAVWPQLGDFSTKFTHLKPVAADIEHQHRSKRAPGYLPTSDVAFVTTYPKHAQFTAGGWAVRNNLPVEMQCYPIEGGDLEDKGVDAVDFCAKILTDLAVDKSLWQIALPLWKLTNCSWVNAKVDGGMMRRQAVRLYLCTLTRRAHALGFKVIRFWEAKFPLPEMMNFEAYRLFLLEDLPMLKSSFEQKEEAPSPVATNVADRLKALELAGAVAAADVRLLKQAIDDRDHRHQNDMRRLERIEEAVSRHDALFMADEARLDALEEKVTKLMQAAATKETVRSPTPKQPFPNPSENW